MRNVSKVNYLYTVLRALMLLQNYTKTLNQKKNFTIEKCVYSQGCIISCVANTKISLHAKKYK